jgi:hypothetical protein
MSWLALQAAYGLIVYNFHKKLRLRKDPAGGANNFDSITKEPHCVAGGNPLYSFCPLF